MSTTSKTAPHQTRYHHDAYQFLFAALRHAQRELDRLPNDDGDDEEAHISGYELLQGVRDLAISQFGLLTPTVFKHWGVRGTDDFGRMVFELIDRGEMRRTEHDHLSDFINVFDFEDAFDRSYRIDTSHAFGY
ncbi:MAG: Minf_1886 family protein [Planctomycetaceae bacterium]